MNKLKLPEAVAGLNPDEFRYNLPRDRIALYPLPERDKSKLLIYNNGIISENIFRNIHLYLPSGSLMIFNNSRVIRARLYFEKETGARIEVFCLEPIDPSDYALSMSSCGVAEWKCLVGNAGKWRKGTIKCSFKKDNTLYYIYAEKLEAMEEGTWRIRFTWDNDRISFGEVLEIAGHIPLPPYITREDEPSDAGRYQTVYSCVEGSVAAPTAGLHFTTENLEQIRIKGIRRFDLTLHVGAGTFKPLKANRITEHEMHSEIFNIDYQTIKAIRNKTGPVIAVGTTSLRSLESLYMAGIRISREPDAYPEIINIDQWEPYQVKDTSLSTEDSLDALLDWMKRKGKEELTASTKLLIVPGYSFSVTDILLTNFHLPGSTLLMLVSAFAGPGWKLVYDYALQHNFRFLSYGDSSLLFRNRGSES